MIMTESESGALPSEPVPAEDLPAEDVDELAEDIENDASS